MIAILTLLQELLSQSVLEALLKSMSKADRRKYDHGESVQKTVVVCRRSPQNDLEKAALEYYNSVMADVDETLVPLPFPFFVDIPCVGAPFPVLLWY
jgi:hypothetical protein